MAALLSLVCVRLTLALFVFTTAFSLPARSNTATNFADSLKLLSPSPFLVVPSQYSYQSGGLLNAFSTTTIDRPLIRTVAGNFLSLQEWTFTIDVASGLDDNIIFVGFGQATSNPLFNNEPSNAFTFRIHSLNVLSSTPFFGRIDAAVMGATASPFVALRENLGTYSMFQSLQVVISRKGDNLTFSIPSQPLASFTFRISNYADALGLTSTNSYLFFGGGTGSLFSNITVSTPTVSFTDSLLGPTSLQLSIPTAKYSYQPLGLVRTQSNSGTSNGTDRPLVKTLGTDFLTLQNWKMELDVTGGASNDDIIFVGFGQATSNSLASNEPANAFTFRIHSLVSSNFFRIDAAVMNNTASPFSALQAGMGTLPRAQKTTFVIKRLNDYITLSIPSQGVSRTFSVSQYASALGLDGSNGHLFFGNSSVGTTFSNLKVTLNVDTTAPTIAVTLPIPSSELSKGAYYENQVVLANFACQDEIGGSGVLSCVGTNPNNTTIDTTLPVGQTKAAKRFRVDASDKEANTSFKTVDYFVYKDQTAPLGTMTVTPSGDVFSVNELVTLTSFSCKDANTFPDRQSGVNQCSARVSYDGGSTFTTASSGTVIDTSKSGNVILSVVALDNALNTSTNTRTITVLPSDPFPSVRGVLSPQGGATYASGSSLTPEFHCVDTVGNPAGIKSCLGYLFFVNANGTFTPITSGTAAGQHASGTPFALPNLASDQASHLFVFRIEAIDVENNREYLNRQFAVGGTDSVGTFLGDTTSRGVVTASLFVADTGKNQILNIDPLTGDKQILPIFGATLNGPTGLAVANEHRNMVIANTGNNEILWSDLATGATSIIASASEGINNPIGVAVDLFGNILIANSGTNEVLMLDVATGSILPIADAMSGLNNPSGVAVAPNGNIIIANQGAHQILQVDAVTRAVSIVADTSQGMNSPAGVASDASGNIFVANSGSNQILRIDATTRAISIAAGTGVAGSGGDGGSATSAQFNHPTAVAVSKDGSLFIADTNNNAIRKVLGAAPPEGAVALSVAAPFDQAGYSILQSTVDPALRTIQYSCTDPGGVQYCKMLVSDPSESLLFNSSDPTLTTSGAFITPADQVGSYAINLVATDHQGLNNFRTLAYRVVYKYVSDFTASSITPIKGTIGGGRAVPVKFQLQNATGASVFPTEGLNVFLKAPESGQLNCQTGAVLSEAGFTSVDTSGNSPALTYNAPFYSFAWKTDQAWTGQCRQLRLFFKDGTVQTARFDFRVK